MAKNIVVLSDGTMQEGGAGNDSNVYRLFRMLENRTSDQITFYDRGVGTGWRKVTGPLFGMGITENILECYEFIFENYEAGDRIFLFGFSRGATTVRSLSGFIDEFGILPKSRPELIRRAYRIYKIRDQAKRKARADEFAARHHTMWCRIRFLGVWDTVVALGIPLKRLDDLVDKIPGFRHRFHDLHLSDSVEHARHALAVDDGRLTFHPKLWEAKTKDYQTMKQVWFCGMHTDVGGGYKEHGLSDIPLIWMVAEAREHGLKLCGRHKVPIGPCADGKMHDSCKGFPGVLYGKGARSWDSGTRGRPMVHESVLIRKRNNNNVEAPPYAPWILAMEHDVEPWPESMRSEKPFPLSCDHPHYR